jgi:hypothetical protein
MGPTFDTMKRHVKRVCHIKKHGIVCSKEAYHGAVADSGVLNCRISQEGKWILTVAVLHAF